MNFKQVLPAVALTLSVSAQMAANAEVFQMKEVPGQGSQVSAAESKCGAGSCGAAKAGEHKCGTDKKDAEHKCGTDKKDATHKCGTDKKECKHADHKCGAEHKCGTDKKEIKKETEEKQVAPDKNKSDAASTTNVIAADLNSTTAPDEIGRAHV